MSIFNKKSNNDKVVKPASQKVTDKQDEKKKEPNMKDLYEEKPSSRELAKEGAGDDKKRAHRAYASLIRPLITEKASNLIAQNKYVFAVNISSNKIEIAKAIEGLYSVKPIKVDTVRVEGKKVKYGRMSGKRKDWKKAIVTLPKGKNIKVYEGV
jgi:large subunit ribosomal protein L23